MHLARILPLAATIVFCASGAYAETQGPLWLRGAAISPDGSRIAFTYRGRIFTVEAEGGEAHAVTSSGHYSHSPAWHPDSREIAFASDVNGDDDVFVTDAANGVRRLTWSSRPEAPTNFTPDGSKVLFTSTGLGDPVGTMQTPLSGTPHLYEVEAQGGRRAVVLPNQAEEAVWNDDATRLLYSYNPSFDPGARQHRVASNARQIWVFDKADGRHTRLLDGAHDAFNPLWGPDGRNIYYLGEESGTLNVWVHDTETRKRRQITFHEEYPVRDLSISGNGDLAYFQGGRLNVLRPGDNRPRQIEVTFSERRMGQPQRTIGFDTSEFVSSPDGAYMAAVISAEIFLLDRMGNARQLTDTVDPERGVAFSPDGRLLAYAAQRGNVWGIYGVDLRREEVGDSLALAYEEQPLVVGVENAFQPAFSPDGSKLAYVHARREVRVLDLATGQTYTPYSAEDYNTSYRDGDIWFAWSPDSRHIVASWKTVPFALTSKAGIMPADASAPIRSITDRVPDIESARFSADGTQIIAFTRHFGLRTLDNGQVVGDFYRIFMSDEARADFLDAAEGRAWPRGDEAGPRRYEFQAERNSYLEGRLTRQSAHYPAYEPLAGSPHLLSVAVDIGMSKASVIAIDLRDGDVAEIAEISDVNADTIGYATGPQVLDFKGAEGVTSLPIDNPAGRTFMPVSIEHSVEGDAKRRAAFEQIWADLKFKFYRSDVEGRDWDRIGAHYRRYVDSIATDRELSDLVDEMFGEISASHLFVSFRRTPTGQGTETGSLGIYVDGAHEGAGVRVAAVLPGGPLDRDTLGIGPGTVITSVNGRPIPENGGVARALDGMAGRWVQVGFVRGGEADETVIGVRPITLAEEDALARQRWVDTRRARVSERSRECIVYEHVAGMYNDDYLEAYGRLISARGEAKAALVDVRSNGGGNLHRQLLALLGGKPYAQVGREGRSRALEPLDRWNLPSAVLIDSFSYSDGSIFPQAYQDAELGAVVGDRLLNTGTGVDYVDSLLVPGIRYGIPVQPFRQLDGAYYENLEIVPDVLVPRDPNALDRGEDLKLEAAIDVLMDTIGRDSDCRR